MKPASPFLFRRVHLRYALFQRTRKCLRHLLKKWVISTLIVFFSHSLKAEITVTDDLGYILKLQQSAQTIIALSPHLTELTFEAGAGGKLIARVDHADYPDSAKNILTLGAFNNWNMEQIIALKPDLVLVWLTANGEAPVVRMRELGLNVYVSEPRQLSDISRTILDIGKLAGTYEVAAANARYFNQGISSLKKQYAAEKKMRVFYQVWSGPLMTINGQQLISRVIELCGGENIFANLTTLAPVISAEGLIKENPQVIIGGAKSALQQQWFSQWHQWPEIEAVKKDNLFFVDPDLLNRQTGRMLIAARQVCDYLSQARKGN